MMPDVNQNISDESTKDEVADKYDELFPPLLSKRYNPVPVIGQWTQKLKIKPSIIRQVFCIPEKDQKYVNRPQFEEQGEPSKISNGIIQKTGAYIKFRSGIDHSLNVLISGKKGEVLEAQWLIVEELARQATVAIPVPKEHHPFILGTCGETLNYLQLISVTKIIVPNPYDNLNFIVITGTKDGIDKAAQEIELLTDDLASSISIPIPKEHHKSIVEKFRRNLAHWDLYTVSKIIVVYTKGKSDKVMIKITGTEDGLERARHEIELLLDEQAKLAFEHLSIPRTYHPFIFGPFNEIISQIMYETGTRINVSSSSDNENKLTINGPKEAVALAKTKVLKIYEERKRNCVVISRKVPKSQHKHIIGPQGQTVKEILAETGVSVEVPPVDSSSEIIMLRGEQAKLQSSLELMYSKAISNSSAQLEYNSDILPSVRE